MTLQRPARCSGIDAATGSTWNLSDVGTDRVGELFTGTPLSFTKRHGTSGLIDA